MILFCPSCVIKQQKFCNFQLKMFSADHLTRTLLLFIIFYIYIFGSQTFFVSVFFCPSYRKCVVWLRFYIPDTINSAKTLGKKDGKEKKGRESRDCITCSAPLDYYDRPNIYIYNVHEQLDNLRCTYLVILVAAVRTISRHG